MAQQMLYFLSFNKTTMINHKERPMKTISIMILGAFLLSSVPSFAVTTGTILPAAPKKGFSRFIPTPVKQFAGLLNNRVAKPAMQNKYLRPLIVRGSLLGMGAAATAGGMMVSLKGDHNTGMAMAIGGGALIVNALALKPITKEYYKVAVASAAGVG